MTIDRDKLRQALPGITDADLTAATNDTDRFVREYAQRTGQDENQVRQQVQSASK